MLLDAGQMLWKSPVHRYNCLHTIHKHRAAVTDLSIHPLGEYGPYCICLWNSRSHQAMFGAHRVLTVTCWRRRWTSPGQSMTLPRDDAWGTWRPRRDSWKKRWRIENDHSISTRTWKHWSYRGNKLLTNVIYGTNKNDSMKRGCGPART